MGEIIDPPVEVRAVDNDGNTVTAFDGEVTVSIDSNPGGGTLNGTVTKNATNGTVTFDDLSIDSMGQGYTLEASASDVVDVVSNSFDIVEAVTGYAIDIGGNPASTCSARTIKITAQDSDNNTVTDYTESVDITTSSGHGTWSKSAADGTLTDSTADDGAASYDFVASDDASIDLDLANQHADDLTITVTESDGSPSSTSATLEFRHNAFVIEARSALANKTNDDLVAGLDQPFQATLMRRKPPTPAGECGAATNYDDPNQSVKLWYEPHSDDPGGDDPKAAGITLPGSKPASANVTLDFSDQSPGGPGPGKAEFSLQTTDVGKYSLAMEDTTFAEDTGGNPRRISGSTNDLVVRPFALRVTAAGNPAASDANEAAYRPAGTTSEADATFDATVTAVQYQAADDDGGDGGTADDGLADGHSDAMPGQRADLSDNAATPSFGQEGTSEDVDVTAELWKPSGQDDPGLGNGSPLTFASFTSGSQTQSTAFNEVGIVELRASLADGDYLGSGIDVTGRSGPVGRFHPDRLKVTTANQPAFRNEVSAAFTYMGQEFGYDAAADMRPRVTIKALSADGTTALDNYGGNGSGADADFWLLPTNIPARDYTDTSGATTNLAAPAGGTVTWDLGSGDTRTDYDAQATFEVQDDRFTYERLSAAAAERQAPFEAAVNLEIPAGDLSDGDACFDPDDNGTCDPFRVDGDNATAGVQPIGGTDLRYGRLVIENANGSELAPVAAPVRVEFWQNDTWKTNSDDVGTTLTVADEFWLTNGEDQAALGDADTVAGDQSIALAQAPSGCDTQAQETTIEMGDVAGGRTELTFDAPGSPCQGWIAAVPKLGPDGLDEHPFLQYDWGTDGNRDDALDDDPRGRVTFGIFEGNTNWIHFRRTR